MLEALNFDFFQNALISALLLSIISGVIGSLIVVNRMVFLSGGIAHTSYGGIGIAVFLGLPIFFGATAFAVVSAVLLSFFTLKQKDNIDILVGLTWAIGMAIGIILIDLTDGYNVDMMSYLFGSILAVTNSDLIIMLILSLLIIFIVVKYYREILAISYDREYAQLKGINVKLFYTIILVMSALTIVVAIKLVGLILVMALLTIPIYISSKYVNSLSKMMLFSSVLSAFFSIVGLFLSYKFDLTSGATIILTSATGLLLSNIIDLIKKTNYSINNK